eukprot:1649286-Pyramimonas_sp.AAC.1
MSPGPVALATRCSCSRNGGVPHAPGAQAGICGACFGWERAAAALELSAPSAPLPRSCVTQ